MIGFLHPWALAALPLAGIPLLLHLIARREPPTVLFPAVRYLVATTQESHRRLKLQNWLLLLTRTLVVLGLVLLAAGPTIPARGAGSHAPSALVLVVDNSLSSGAVSGGNPVLSPLGAAARSVLSGATPNDRVWLLTSTLMPTPGDAVTLARVLDSLQPAAGRLDLGAAIVTADRLLATQQLPGEIVLVTDLQATAVSAARPAAPLTVLRPTIAPPRNAGVAAVDPGGLPWPPAGGRVVVALSGDSGARVSVTATLGNRPPRQALGAPGMPASIALAGAGPGWTPLSVAIDPDELRADDRRDMAIWTAPVAAISWDSTDRYINAAASVLMRNGRVLKGADIVIDRLGPGPSIVFPPADPAQLGAVNRALDRRGVPWQFGELVTDPSATDSGAVVGRVPVRRRYRLVPGQSGRTGVLASVAGQPWMTRSGDVVLIASRLEPAWTDLPVSAGFMPFMDRLVNRVARGEAAVEEGAVGEPVLLPDLVTEVRQGERRWEIEGGAAFRPPVAGVFYLVGGRDTVGVLSAAADPRESDLRRLPDDDVRRMWPAVRLAGLDEARQAAFRAGARADLRSTLIWVVLLAGLAEVLLASGRPAVRGRSA